MLNIVTSQNQLEDLIRDSILYALGKRIVNAATVAELRAFTTQGMTGASLYDDALAAIVVSGSVTAAYRWSQKSTAVDNGTTIIKPNDAPATGRWLAWTSNVRFVPVVGGNSFYLHEIAQGPIERVLVLDKAMDASEMSALINGNVPAVYIEVTDDNPEDYTLGTGARWDTKYDFTTSVITQNLRDRRQATHGSAADSEVGANNLDGFIKALLSGTNLSPQESGIRNVQIGRGFNWFSDEAQRRVIRSRAFTFQVTEENPAAPNDAGPAQEVDFQANMTDIGEGDPTLPFDTQNYVTSGIDVTVGAGLTKPVHVGAALFGGVTVAYAGELKTFTANKDTYRDLLPNGTLVFVENFYSDNIEEEPPVTATALRIGMTRTDNDGVLSDRMIAQTYEPFGPVYIIPLT